MLEINWTAVLIVLLIIATVVAVVQNLRLENRDKEEDKAYEKAQASFLKLLHYKWSGVLAFKSSGEKTPQEYKWETQRQLFHARRGPESLMDLKLGPNDRNHSETLDKLAASKAEIAADTIKQEIMSMKSTEDVHELVKALDKLIPESGKSRFAFASDGELDKGITGTITNQAWTLYQRWEPGRPYWEVLQTLQVVSTKLRGIPDLSEKTTALDDMSFDSESGKLNIAFPRAFEELAAYAGLSLPSDDAPELDAQAAPDNDPAHKEPISEVFHPV